MPPVDFHSGVSIAKLPRVVHFSLYRLRRILLATPRANHSASRPCTVGRVNYLTFSAKSNCLAGEKA